VGRRLELHPRHRGRRAPPRVERAHRHRARSQVELAGDRQRVHQPAQPLARQQLALDEGAERLGARAQVIDHARLVDGEREPRHRRLRVDPQRHVAEAAQRGLDDGARRAGAFQARPQDRQRVDVRRVAAVLEQLEVPVAVAKRRRVGQREEPRHALHELRLAHRLEPVTIDAPREEQHVAEQTLRGERVGERRFRERAVLDEQLAQPREAVAGAHLHGRPTREADHVLHGRSLRNRRLGKEECPGQPSIDGVHQQVRERRARQVTFGRRRGVRSHRIARYHSSRGEGHCVQVGVRSKPPKNSSAIAVQARWFSGGPHLKPGFFKASPRIVARLSR
jgi:hypothetical protein